MVDEQTQCFGSRYSSLGETILLAMEAAQLGFWDHDIVRDQIYRSEEWSRMLGYTTAEVEDNRNFWLEHVHPDDRMEVDRSIHDHEAGIQKTFRIEHRMKTKGGQWKWVLNWGQVVERDAAGVPLRALGFHLDISDRKQAEETMARVDKLATIGTLAGGIAHDFNNLLTAIQGNLELARGCTQSGPKKLYIANAERAARRSQNLTTRLLTFAKDGSPTIEAVDLEQVVTEARDLVLSGSKSRLRVEVPAGLPSVAGCRVQLCQVFQNLLINADQAMPEGGLITVHCAALNIEQPIERVLHTGSYVEAVVADQGPGIPDGMVGRIFDPFYSTRPGGQGLGLAVVHSIISNHGGQVEVVPSGGVGARLRVLLPMASIELLKKPRSETPVAPALQGRILVVDDDQHVRELTVAIVEKMGFEAIGTDDGAKAVELCHRALRDQNAFAAVVMDLNMSGGMGGKEAAALILLEDPSAALIVTSGYPDDPVMANCREYGFCDSLAKPYAMGDLRRILERRSLRHEG